MKEEEWDGDILNIPQSTLDTAIKLISILSIKEKADFDEAWKKYRSESLKVYP